MMMLGHSCLNVVGWETPSAVPVGNMIPLLLSLVDHVLLNGLVRLVRLRAADLIQDISVDVRR